MKGGPNSLWFLNNPSGDGKGMEIIEQRPYGYGINDLSKSKAYHYARSYVCKIPCSKGNMYFVVFWKVKNTGYFKKRESHK